MKETRARDKTAAKILFRVEIKYKTVSSLPSNFPN
jgi:hypothetical protein